MKSILIEGTEMSGKSTLSKKVEEALSFYGFSTRLNSGPIRNDNPLVHLPLSLAKKANNSHLKEFLYTMSLVADSFPRDRESIDFFIQDREAPSVIAYSYTFNDFGINRFLLPLLKGFYLKFDYNILLVSDKITRSERIESREFKTPLDKMVGLEPHKGEKLENYMRLVLSKEKNYLEINTSETDQEKCKNKILERVL